MYRVPTRLARVALPALGATFLLSGCMTIGSSGPAGLGAEPHRSIKDDPEPAIYMPAAKQAPPAKTAIALPPPRRHAARAVAKRPQIATCTSGSECMVRLKAMIDDPSRSWIGKAQPPVEYANGTRLFAYRALRSQLTCPQLSTALNEVIEANGMFRGPVSGVGPAQAKRVLALSADVEQELKAELAGRCKR